LSLVPLVPAGVKVNAINIKLNSLESH